MNRPSLTHDNSAGVLYVKLPAVRIVRSAPIDGDDFVVLNFDGSGDVVGLQLMDVAAMTQSHWREFFRTGEIPSGLFERVDEWLGERAPQRRSLASL